MDKVVLISIPETSIRELIEQSVKKALSELKNEEPSKGKTVFNFKEACAYIGISESHGYRLTSKNLIPFSKRGKKLYFDKEEIDKWLLENRAKDSTEIQNEAIRFIHSKSKKR
jgi:excisionase family DNA binding protein